MNSKEISKKFIESGLKAEDFEVICNENIVNIQIKNPNVRKEDVEKALFSSLRTNENSLMCVFKRNRFIEVSQSDAMLITEKLLMPPRTPSKSIEFLKDLFSFEEDEPCKFYQKIGNQEQMLKVKNLAELCITLFKFAIFGEVKF